jgi:hypothetical protein
MGIKDIIVWINDRLIHKKTICELFGHDYKYDWGLPIHIPIYICARCGKEADQNEVFKNGGFNSSIKYRGEIR